MSIEMTAGMMAADTLVRSDKNALQRKIAISGLNFARLTDALEAGSVKGRGLSFYDVRGACRERLSHSDLKVRAQSLAARILSRFDRGDRVGIVAETSPDFVVAFFACQYAGVIPAPLPLPVNLGGKEGYLQQIRQMCLSADARGVIGPKDLESFLVAAIDGLANTQFFSFDELRALPTFNGDIRAFEADEMCYIQFSSGSTSAPKGVIGTQASVCANLYGIATYGVQVTDDDAVVSWLPLYHDMGLIGCMLTPIFTGVDGHFLATSDFVRRPLLWLRLLTETGATMTYSPSFGYELAARRAVRAEPGSIDLARLRVAGIGADMVRPEALNAFADAFSDSGFKAGAFLPSYGMAEATLAITFTEIGEAVKLDDVDVRLLNRSGTAQPVSAITPQDKRRSFVRCGRPLPGHDLQVRDDAGVPLSDRREGRIFIKGPSLTPGYYGQVDATRDLYDGDWLDTGDMGYMLDGNIVITGRAKDLIIINGRNIWPQDIEWAVEEIDGVRKNGVAAFSVDDGASERIVVVTERRGGMTADELAELKREIAKIIQMTAGAPAEIVLARPHSMVLTSSGKLSRSKVKEKFLSGAFEQIENAEPEKAFAEAGS
ncbi:MAG: fatty acyl-AMP ligase [Pseudomonadota bacterium]